MFLFIAGVLIGMVVGVTILFVGMAMGRYLRETEDERIR